MKSEAWLLLPVLFLSGDLAWAQKPVPALNPLDVLVTASEVVAVTDPISIGIEIRNVSDEQITVDSASIEIPEAFALGPRLCQDKEKRENKELCVDNVLSNKKKLKDRTVAIQVPVGKQLDPRGSVSVSKKIVRAGFWSDITGCMVYRCAKDTILVSVTYTKGTAAKPSKGTVAEPSEGTATKGLDLRPRANLFAVIAGGVVGVIVATIFSLLYKVYSSSGQPVAPQASATWWWRYWKSVSSTLLSIFYGSFATAAAILLLTVTTGADFPVSVSVCDSLGGLILGLFFKPVGEFIYSKISG